MNVYVCLSLCLSVREEISRTTCPNVSYGRGSVLLRRRCGMLCTSGCTSDAIFAMGHMSISLQRVTSLRRRAQANAPAASY